MGIISVGGLATGLDTNSIVDKLVRLERQRSVGALEAQRTDARARQNALQAFNTKVLAFLGAVDELAETDDVLIRKATSSNTTVLTVAAEGGAAAGSTTITVGTLARASIATAANGTTSTSAPIATGSGSFAFQVGSAAVQTIAIDATTTLDDLAAAINETDAGVRATVVNLGTSAAPDYRLRIASNETGTSNAVTIVTDDTTLGVAVTQAAENASFSVSGFADPFTRETNTVSDVIPGVTLSFLATGGPSTVTVATDGDAVAAAVDAVVKAFNDVVSFVASESQVRQDTSSDDRTVTIGPLALDGTVRSVLDSLHALISERVEGLSGDYALLAEVGVTTSRDGTLAFDAATLKAALASGEVDVAGLLAGNGGVVGGVADRLAEYLRGITDSGGTIGIRTASVTAEIQSLEERIAAGERSVDAFEENLRATFVSLETLVNSLQSQGAFLLGALGRSAT